MFKTSGRAAALMDEKSLIFIFFRDYTTRDRNMFYVFWEGEKKIKVALFK